MLTHILKEVMSDYLPTYHNDGTETLTTYQKTTLDQLLDFELARKITQLINDDSFEVTRHTGVGRIADVSWIGIHHKNINSEAKTGIYVCLLFHVDGAGLSLSIQHGADNLNLSAIKSKVQTVKDSLEFVPAGFHSGNLFLRPIPTPKRLNKNSTRPAKYEIANIIGKSYSFDQLFEELFIQDLLTLVHYYKTWAEGLRNNFLIEDEIYQSLQTKEDSFDMAPPGKSKSALDITVKAGTLYPPRDPRQGYIALYNANWMCEADETHLTFHTKNNKPYMEKHHLIPMEFYFSYDITIDHYLNIFSLCPTCHRKIHLGQKSEKLKLITFLFNKRIKTYSEVYKTKIEQLLLMYGVKIT